MASGDLSRADAEKRVEREIPPTHKRDGANPGNSAHIRLVASICLVHVPASFSTKSRLWAIEIASQPSTGTLDEHLVAIILGRKPVNRRLPIR